MNAEISSNKRVRILILRGGAIGDFILTLPAIAALRSHWPNAYIEIIGYPRIAQLALAGGLANTVLSLDKAEMARLFSLRPGFTESQKEYFRSFDLIFSYLYDPGNTVTDNITAIGVRHFASVSPVISTGHAIEQLMRPLDTVALYPAQNERPRLVLEKEWIEFGRKETARFPAGLILIQPGSGSPHKNWPLNRFLALADLLTKDRSLNVAFLLGEAEHGWETALREQGRQEHVFSGLSLVETASLLAASCGYAGNDSGITHLAAAADTPTVALFGASDPSTWGPRGKHVRIINRPGSLAAICPDEVASTLIPLLKPH